MTKDYEDDELNGSGRGKKINQKLKPYLVLQYLMKYSDEEHPLSAPNIVEYLKESCGIYAERRSIYKDIEEINKALLMTENHINISEAEEMLANDIYDEDKMIVYDSHRKGFYVKRRNYDLYDIRLLAECVYSAKFIEVHQAKRLADIVCNFVSEAQAEQITHDSFLTDRVKTHNKDVINNITVINEAMHKEADHKITFKYLKYSISNLSQQIERKHGAKYIVSPFALLISDGNYYLLAFDDRSKELRTYRVDRMKKVSAIDEPREGHKAFAAVDLKSYTKRVFSMFSGKPERLTICFANFLLDTVIERFGMKDVQYSQMDDTHFTATTEVEISNQFYGWICGFGNDAKILLPKSAVLGFTEYIDKIRNSY